MSIDKKDKGLNDDLFKQEDWISKKTGTIVLPALWGAINILLIGLPSLLVEAVSKTINEEKESRNGK